MTHAIRIHETGGPEKLTWEDIPLPAPKADEALVRHKAVGLNFIDVYFRTGLYKAPALRRSSAWKGRASSRPSAKA
jgi:NADPH2:quinone reductase